MSSHFSKLSWDLSCVVSVMWPECSRKVRRCKSYWLHPWESRPAVDQRPGCVDRNFNSDLALSRVGTCRTIRGCWKPWGISSPVGLLPPRPSTEEKRMWKGIFFPVLAPFALFKPSTGTLARKSANFFPLKMALQFARYFTSVSRLAHFSRQIWRLKPVNFLWQPKIEF